MDAYFIIGNNVDLDKFDFTNSMVIGVDRGAYLAYKSNIKLDYAIGDFDSISAQELELLYGYTKVIELNPIKDETDTLYALNMFKECDKLYVLGGISGPRIDHFVANLKLFYKFPNLIMIDNNTMIMEIKSDCIIPKDEYKYISLFALEDVYDLTLSGFKYTLDGYLLKIDNPLCVSNEIASDAGKISFSKGKLLLIKTKE